MKVTIEPSRIIVELELGDTAGLNELARIVLPELGRMMAAALPAAVPDQEELASPTGPTERAA